MRVVMLLLAVIASLTLSTPAQAAPERLVIDKIDVNVPIISVEQRGGALALGDDLWTAYRWRAGVKTCAPGSVAFAVHAYEVPGGRALGNRVSNLTRGDKIRIPGKCSYRVTSNTVVKASTSLASCYSFDGRARGCIITCVNRVGPGEYTHRRVIRFTRQ